MPTVSGTGHLGSLPTLRVQEGSGKIGGREAQAVPSLGSRLCEFVRSVFAPVKLALRGVWAGTSQLPRASAQARKADAQVRKEVGTLKNDLKVGKSLAEINNRLQRLQLAMHGTEEMSQKHAEAIMSLLLKESTGEHALEPSQIKPVAILLKDKLVVHSDIPKEMLAGIKVAVATSGGGRQQLMQPVAVGDQTVEVSNAYLKDFNRATYRINEKEVSQDNAVKAVGTLASGMNTEQLSAFSLVAQQELFSFHAPFSLLSGQSPFTLTREGTTVKFDPMSGNHQVSFDAQTQADGTVLVDARCDYRTLMPQGGGNPFSLDDPVTYTVKLKIDRQGNTSVLSGHHTWVPSEVQAKLAEVQA